MSKRSERKLKRNEARDALKKSLIVHGKRLGHPPSRGPRSHMRRNEETVLVGRRAVLVPYRKEHVDTYHDWMKDPHIQQQTASEPLTLAQEYAMQQSWHVDEDKLTFIVLARRQADETGSATAYASAGDAIADATMTGDVNLFISARHQEDEDEGEDRQAPRTQAENAQTSHDAELEVMIAEPSQRRRGLAREALGMLMHYSSTEGAAANNTPGDAIPLPLPHDAFVAKIGLDNTPSLAMFQSMGFHQVRQSTVWNEAELRPDPRQRDVFHASLFAPLQVLHWPMDGDRA